MSGDAAPGGAIATSRRDDLLRRSDVHDLVVAFYRDVVFDDLLAPVFGEVAEVDWSTHLPRLIDYWCRVLFGDPDYDGSILGPHQRVHDLAPFRPELFDRWYLLWSDAIDRHWSGPNATRAKDHAARIAGVLSRRLTGTPWEGPTTRPEAVDRSDLGGDPSCWAHLFDDWAEPPAGE
jgi:hemoglobin